MAATTGTAVTMAGAYTPAACMATDARCYGPYLFAVPVNSASLSAANDLLVLQFQCIIFLAGFALKSFHAYIAMHMMTLLRTAGDRQRRLEGKLLPAASCLFPDP